MEISQGEGAVFKVEIFADTICPWCFVGTRFLYEAMASLPRAAFQIKWRPYMIAPDIGDDGEPMRDFMEKRYGKAIDLDDPESVLSKAITAAGIRFNVLSDSTNTNKKEEIRPKLLTKHMWNSAASHKLIEIAGNLDETQGPCVSGEYGLQTVVMEHIFDSYFKDGTNISSTEALLSIAQKIGIQVTRECLSDVRSSDFATKSMQIADDKKINGVPFFFISRDGYPGSYRLSGAQPPQVLMKAFESLLIPRDELIKKLRLKSRIRAISKPITNIALIDDSPKYKKHEKLPSICIDINSDGLPKHSKKRRCVKSRTANLLRFHMQATTNYEIEAAAAALSGVRTKKHENQIFSFNLSNEDQKESTNYSHSTALPSPSSGDEPTSFPQATVPLKDNIVSSSSEEIKEIVPLEVGYMFGSSTCDDSQIYEQDSMYSYLCHDPVLGLRNRSNSFNEVNRVSRSPEVSPTSS